MATKAKRKAARDKRRRAGTGGGHGHGPADVEVGDRRSPVVSDVPVGANVASAGAKRDKDGDDPPKGRGGPGKAQRKGSSGGRVTARQPKYERYTPPTPKSARKSPKWMGWSIIGLFLLGVLIIILNYADVLPGGVDNWWLVGAIAAIFGGLMVATQYH